MAAKPHPPEPLMILSLVQLARPHQWTKNLLCLAGAIFGSHFTQGDISRALLTALAFSIGSSSIYVLNDIVDRQRDKKHPKKCRRPVASGAISVPVAVVFGICLAAAALVGTWFLGRETFTCMSVLLVVNVAYSTYLKHAAILDVLCIALGFVLRLMAGIYAVDDTPTTWITLCTFFLAMFFGFSKRRGELQTLANQESSQRPVLDSYTVGYLDDLLNSAATITILCYALFTVTSDKSPSLILTLPFVYYGIVRYKRLISLTTDVEEPERVVFRDSRILLTFVLWLGSYLAIEHWKPEIFRSSAPTTISTDE